MLISANFVLYFILGTESNIWVGRWVGCYYSQDIH